MKQSGLWSFLLIFVACGSSIPTDDEPGPHQTLLTITRMSEKGDFTGVEDYLWGVEFGKNLNSRDTLIDGFKAKNNVGDFSFTEEGFIAAATDYKNLFVRGDQEILNDYFLKDDSFFHKFPEVLAVAVTEPERIWSFQIGDVIMILIEDGGTHKILYSKHMGVLKRRPK